MSTPMREEFEYEFEEKWCYLKMFDTHDYKDIALWAARWMAERCVEGVGHDFCSNPDRPQENMIGSDVMHKIRQLAKDLEG